MDKLYSIISRTANIKISPAKVSLTTLPSEAAIPLTPDYCHCFTVIVNQKLTFVQ